MVLVLREFDKWVERTLSSSDESECDDSHDEKIPTRLPNGLFLAVLFIEFVLYAPALTAGLLPLSFDREHNNECDQIGTRSQTLLKYQTRQQLQLL